MLSRAFSVLTVKSIDEDQRIIRGVATTPEADRIGDIVEPLGAIFKNPLPLLLFHKADKPVGTAVFDTPTKKGIEFTASLPRINEPGTLRDRVEEAWQSLKAGLIRGVSIGFNALEDGVELLKTGGLRFTKTEILELSLVTVPANASASIQTIKSIVAEQFAMPARNARGSSSSGASDTSRRTGPMKKTIAERKQVCVAEKAAKVARMNELMGEDDGATLDAAGQEAFATLTDEIKAIDDQLARLETLDRVTRESAVVVKGGTPEEASTARSTQTSRVITFKENLPPGYQLARAVICKINAYINHVNAYEVAKGLFPSDTRVQEYLRPQYQRGTVAAGTTTDTDWATALVDPTNLASEFIEYLRPMTIVGKFGTGGIPALRNVPFNVRIVGQTTGGTANWVGQAKPKPLTKFHFAPTTLTWAKIAAISVISDELARFSVPGAEGLVRDALSETIVEKIDTDFIDPDVAVSADVSPASITNGVTPLSSAGPSADNIRSDIQNLLEQFILNNQRVTGLVLIMPETLALAASIMVNDLGQREFPDLEVGGGRLLGIPVITSQYAADEGTHGNLLIAVNAREVFLSDDGQVSIDVSREAALEMLDTGFTQSQPTGASLVSLWQNNLLGIKAERYINWKKRRAEAVSYMDDVNWGSVGSPA
jgi:HK97 family phage major capsid protein/HK97 family phage prohead protease